MNGCRARSAGLLLLLLLLATPCSAAKQLREPAELLLGMSTALSGPLAEIGVELRRGVLAGLERANRSGGIHGRRLHLIVLDDGYEPARAAPNVQRLLDEFQVQALIGNVGTPTAIASIPIARDRRTLFFAPFSGAGVLRRDPPDRYVINYRASYAEEIEAMVDALIDIGGLRPEEIAFFTQRDSYGDAGYVGGFQALKKHGLKNELSILHVRYQRNTMAVENALADILMSDPLPRAVIMVGAYAPCAKFIRLARESGLHSLFLNVSFVGSESLAAALPTATAGVLVTQVVPDPFTSKLPLVLDYRTDLERLEPGSRPSSVSLEGYISARILLLALAGSGPPINRERIIDRLEKLGRFDLGLGEPLHLSPNHHQASHRVWPTRLEKRRFIPFDWRQIKRLLPDEEESR
ncbi:MAG: ABC transporter substrate-binding protein [Deltaproteobacteria bacterium]|nr:ABC transporter substrate-binding protein [Deltaproteobacteria bacterium]